MLPNANYVTRRTTGWYHHHYHHLFAQYEQQAGVEIFTTTLHGTGPLFRKAAIPKVRVTDMGYCVVYLHCSVLSDGRTFGIVDLSPLQCCLRNDDGCL